MPEEELITHFQYPQKTVQEVAAWNAEGQQRGLKPRELMVEITRQELGERGAPQPTKEVKRA